MPMLEMDGIGKVDVDNKFLSLTPAQQAVEVDAIARQIRGQHAPVNDPTAPRTELGMVTDEQVAQQSLNQQGAPTVPPAPGDIVERGAILPIGKTAAGDIVPALPQAIEGPRKTIADLMSGRRTPDQVTGEEAFNLGLLFAGGGGATGTSKAVTRAFEGKQAAKVADEALGPVVGPATQTARPAVEAPVAIPKDAEAARAASGDLFKKIDDAGVVLKPEAMETLTKEIASDLTKVRLNPTLHPNAAAALDEIAAATGTSLKAEAPKGSIPPEAMSTTQKRIAAALAEIKGEQPSAANALKFSDLQTLREIVNDAGRNAKGGDAMRIGMIREKIDDFVSGLSTKDTLAGDPRVASELFPKARDLWHRAGNLDKIAALVERAKNQAPQYAASGMEHALRTQFKQFANKPREMKFFSPEEQKIILAITRERKAIRNVGKLSPSTPFNMLTAGAVGGYLSGAIGLGTLPGVMAAQGTGITARMIATALVKKNVAKLEEMVRSGGASPLATQAIAKGNGILKELGTRAVQASTAQAIKPQDRRNIGKSSLAIQ